MVKSNRKDKNCHVSVPNVGMRDKVIGHCPPDLTDSVKEALLKEIEEFKRNPLIAVKIREEIEASAEGKAAIDAYHDWLQQNEGQELPEANPDVLADDEGINYLPSNKDNETVRLLKEFRQALTVRELQVWNLIMHHQYSLLATAKLLKLSESSIRTYLIRAKDKFLKYVEAMKRENRNETKG